MVTEVETDERDNEGRRGRITNDDEWKIKSNDSLK